MRLFGGQVRMRLHPKRYGRGTNAHQRPRKVAKAYSADEMRQLNQLARSKPAPQTFLSRVRSFVRGLGKRG